MAIIVSRWFDIREAWFGAKKISELLGGEDTSTRFDRLAAEKFSLTREVAQLTSIYHDMSKVENLTTKGHH